jgi:hypothetical protein
VYVPHEFAALQDFSQDFFDSQELLIEQSSKQELLQNDMVRFF